MAKLALRGASLAIQPGEVVAVFPEGTTSDGFSIIKSQLTLMIQDSTGHFTPSTTTELPILANAVGTGDINRDGRTDLVIYGSEYPVSGGSIDRVMVLTQSPVTAGQFLDPINHIGRKRGISVCGNEVRGCAPYTCRPFQPCRLPIQFLTKNCDSDAQPFIGDAAHFLQLHVKIET